MFSILKNLKKEFDRSLNKEKLIEFKKNAKSVSDEKLNNYTFEVHQILNKYFNDDEIMKMGIEAIIYFDNIRKDRIIIKNISLF